jgi:hypothetical protein
MSGMSALNGQGSVGLVRGKVVNFSPFQENKQTTSKQTNSQPGEQMKKKKKKKKMNT